MEHRVAVIIKEDYGTDRGFIFHGKGFEMPTDQQGLQEMYAKDIKALTNGLLLAIQDAGEKGLINKVETLENIIDFMKNNISVIELAKAVPSAEDYIKLRK